MTRSVHVIAALNRGTQYASNDPLSILGMLKSPLGPKDCEMTLLRSLKPLGATSAAREDTKFLDDWLLWTVTNLMVSL